MVAVGASVGFGVKVGAGVFVGKGVLVGASVAVGVGATPHAESAMPNDVAPLNLINSRRVGSDPVTGR